MDQNRYEETPKKENPFLKALKIFGKYWVTVFKDFIRSFKYNNMKLPAILVAIPGLLLGFFISFHYPTINSLSYNYIETGSTVQAVSTGTGSNVTELTFTNFDVEGLKATKIVAVYNEEKTKESTSETDKIFDITATTAVVEGVTGDTLEKFAVILDNDDATIVYNLKSVGRDAQLIFKVTINGTDYKFTQQVTKTLLGFDYSAIMLFVLMLAGIMNIFFASNMSSKKNLGSVVTATVSTGVIWVCGILYMVAIFISYSGFASGKIKSSTGWVWDINKIMSLASVILSMLVSAVGVVLGYIFYDRTYEKIDR